MDCCGVSAWIIATAIAGLFLLYRYLTNIYQFFEKQGIPGPKPKLLFGTVWGMWRRPAGYIELDNLKKYGKIYGTFEGMNPLITIAEPELIKNILVKDFHIFPTRRPVKNIFGKGVGKKLLTVLEGEEWKAVRSLVSPTFSTGKLKKMGNLMSECGETLVKNFKKKEGTSILMKDMYGGYTLDVIATCAFGTKIDSLGQENDPFVASAKGFIQNAALESPVLVLFFIAPKLLSFFSLFSKSLAETLNFYQNVVEKILEERGGKATGRGDFLDLMMEEVEKAKNEEEMTPKKKYAVTEVIIAQAVLFFIAGFDTTATVLSWASYYLAVHPQIQEKVFEEIKLKLKEYGAFTHELISDLPYMEMVINETLRIAPVSVRIERKAVEKAVYDGVTVEKGMIAAIPVYAMHHLEEFYQQPEKFIPERFSPEAKAERNPYTFLPFGQGPRNCVGMRFALDELKMALTHVIYNFKFITTVDTQIPPPLYKGLLLCIPKDLKLGVVSRV